MQSRSILSITCFMILIFSSLCFSQDKTIKSTGFFSDMVYNEEAGDVIGMEIFISYSTNGMEGTYWVYFQAAEGVPMTPILVKAVIDKQNIEFDLPDDTGGHFKGHFTEKGLVGKFDKISGEILLKRKNSYWQ